MEEKESYTKKMERQLKKLRARVDALAEKAKAASAEAKAQYDQEFPAIKEKQKVAEQKLDELEKASGAAWEELRYGLESAFTDLSGAIDRAAVKFGKEMK